MRPSPYAQRMPSTLWARVAPPNPGAGHMPGMCPAPIGSSLDFKPNNMA